VRLNEPFRRADLAELDARLFALADRVVPMWDVHCGDTGRGVIGLRHDVDDNPLAFETALAFAEWEFERGYSSTYYLLQGAHYWTAEMMELVPRFEELGHEVGLHVNALALGLREDADPRKLVRRDLKELRATGVAVRGCVAHGDSLCHAARFVNDELFTESARPAYGDPERTLKWRNHELKIRPVSRELFALAYDASWIPRGDYLSDSSGKWSQPFDDVAGRFAARDALEAGQLHVLIHPDWWTEAFVPVAA